MPNFAKKNATTLRKIATKDAKMNFAKGSENDLEPYRPV